VSLEAGSRIGFYQVQSALGAGGMGEVYRAQDPAAAFALDRFGEALDD
jgi:serine/threonine protein kinase